MGWGEAVMGGDDFVAHLYHSGLVIYLLFYFVMKPLVWMAIVLVKCYETYLCLFSLISLQ